MKKEKEKKQKKQRRNLQLKENIYNSPYLILILLTSLAVMVCSDEIGFGAIPEQAQIFVWDAYAKMPGKQDAAMASSEPAPEIGEDVNEVHTIQEDAQQEDSMTDLEGETENAGICKEENDDILNDSGLPADDADAENAENTEEMPKGTTDFLYYEPVQIDSPYYKDAGKIALTTMYPYTKENISYFNDAAFLGDSRTLGISDYAGLEEADFYCDSGMMIFKLLEEGITYQKTGNKVDLTQVLQEKRYRKIYIMLGMNELGYGNTEMYLKKYREVLEKIREWQPGAVIYVMANLHVSREKNNFDSEFNNININDKNAAAASLANGTDIFYLDANPLFTDEEGFLNAELTFDGVHLYAQHYDVWREFLLEHAVEVQDDVQEEGTEAYLENGQDENV